MTPERELAKRVILEIIKQAGGKIGKTKLFKSFWLAHLFYAKKAPGYLTDWPIVRMPKGPGIHHGDRLLDDLIASGNVSRSYEPRGPFTEIVCCLVSEESDLKLSETAVESIRSAVEYVSQHSAESISELSHEFSRSWNKTQDGEELQIYTDLIPDDVYKEKCKELAEMKKAYEELF